MKKSHQIHQLDDSMDDTALKSSASNSPLEAKLKEETVSKLSPDEFCADTRSRKEEVGPSDAKPSPGSAPALELCTETGGENASDSKTLVEEPQPEVSSEQVCTRPLGTMATSDGPDSEHETADSLNRTAPDYQQSERVYPGAVAVKGVDADSLADDDDYTFTAPEVQEEPPVLTATLVPDGEDVGNLQAQLRQRDELLQRRDRQLQSFLSERENVAVAEVIAQDKAAPLRAICSLKGQGFPHGLAEAMALNTTAFSLRMWLLDNSGSMSAADGARLVETSNEHELQCVQCTRWNELQATVKYHAEMAAMLKAPTKFRLLNDPGKVHGPQQFSVAERGEEKIDDDMHIALKCMESTPISSTPLAHHIREIREMVQKLEPTLKQDQTKVAIVIATDGLPTSTNKDISPQQEFVEELRSLEGLPVWIVIRLCTNESRVVSFYNKLDTQVELSLEVLDDFEMESREIYKHNKFLNYAMPLHRCREMGYYHRIFDFLDERKLTKDELGDLFALLFGQRHMAGLPSPHADWKGFSEGMSTIIENEQHQWNPITRKIEPWVDIKKLNQAYGRRAERRISLRSLSLRHRQWSAK